jgi:hypothetical protein
MPSYVPVIKNGANGAILYAGLIDQSNTKLFKSTPTLAAGDFKVSIDGGALNNLGTLPTVTPAAGRQIKITLSQAEVNGDNITVQCVDAAGAEWCDLIINIQTAARQIDDLAFPTVSGRSLDVTATGEAGIDWANVGAPTTVLDLSNTTIKTTQKVDVDTIKTNPVVNGGTITFPTTATLASTTNITAGTITTTTNLTNLPAITANWLTAAGTAADFGTEIAAAIWQDTVAGDFTVAASIGKSVMNGVALGTGLTVATATNVTTVNGLAANVITAAATAADFGTEIATAIWTDAVAGDFTVASSIGKALYIANVAPGAAGGHFISGVNAGTTTVGALTSTGAFSINGVSDVAQTGDNFARLGAPAGASVSADIAGVMTKQMTESYAAVGIVPTPAQALFEARALLAEKAVAATTLTAKKLDGATTAATYTLNDATNPTSITRAS